MIKNNTLMDVSHCKINRIICNPLFLYAVSWFIVISLYLLKWSYIYPQLSLDLFSFLSVTCLLALFFAIKTHKERKFEYTPLVNPKKYYKWVIKQTKRVYLLLISEFILKKTIPFLVYLKGDTNTDTYADFAVPIVHVFVVNGLLFLFFFSSYCYFSYKVPKNCFLKPMLINFVGPLLFMSRGILLYMVFGLFLLYLMSGKRAMNVFKLLVPATFAVLFLFGLLGNLRMNDPNGNLILQIGGASQQFEESIVPNEFFWSYVYITSPLGNLQNAVQKKKRYDSESTGFVPLLVNQVCPMFISKRLEIPLPKDSERYRVAPTLNVGSIYFMPFLTWGWNGMIIVFCFILFYVFAMLNMIPRICVFRVPMYIVLSILTFFSLFDNLLIFMGLFPQFVFIYLLRKVKNV